MIIQDIQIEVSYEKTLTRTVEITTNGGNVSVNDKESDQASVEIAPESRSIKLKPQDGYAIESIKADETEITLKIVISKIMLIPILQTKMKLQRMRSLFSLL